MKKSKSLFSQLYKKAIFYGLVDEGGWFPQMLASRKTTAEYTKLTKIPLRNLRNQRQKICLPCEMCLSLSHRGVNQCESVSEKFVFFSCLFVVNFFLLTFCAFLWLIKSVSIRVHSWLILLRASVPLWLKLNLSAVALAKADQSKQLNYAKRTQFPKKSNVYNINKYNELQRKMQIGHLVKTNPIKPNLW